MVREHHVRRVGAIGAANRAGNRVGHAPANGFDVEGIFLAAPALELYGNQVDTSSIAAQRHGGLSMPAIAHQPAHRHFLAGDSQLTVIVHPILIREGLP